MQVQIQVSRATSVCMKSEGEHMIFKQQLTLNQRDES